VVGVQHEDRAGVWNEVESVTDINGSIESELEKGAKVAPANASLCAHHLVDESDFVEKGKML